MALITRGRTLVVWTILYGQDIERAIKSHRLKVPSSRIVEFQCTHLPVYMVQTFKKVFLHIQRSSNLSALAPFSAVHANMSPLHYGVYGTISLFTSEPLLTERRGMPHVTPIGQ